MGAREAEDADGGWLDAEELAAWRGFMQLAARLPAELGAQLERDCGLSFVEYYVLALLSEQDGLRMRMSELANRANIELSRLSHLVSRLEKREFLRREPDPTDGRCTMAVLADPGWAALVDAAPGHVRQVRALFVDALDREELHAFGRATLKVNARIDSGHMRLGLRA